MGGKLDLRCGAQTGLFRRDRRAGAAAAPRTGLGRPQRRRLRPPLERRFLPAAAGRAVFMTYSANCFAGPDYAVGYATAESPLGPFVKAAENPILERGGEVTGTGHSCLFRTRQGQLLICYHGRTAATGQDRVAFLSPRASRRRAGWWWSGKPGRWPGWQQTGPIWNRPLQRFVTSPGSRFPGWSRALSLFVGAGFIPPAGVRGGARSPGRCEHRPLQRFVITRVRVASYGPPPGCRGGPWPSRGTLHRHIFPVGRHVFPVP